MATQQRRVALYARVSTSDRGQDTEVQLSELRQVAAQRGWKVVGEFIDNGVSGAKTSRPALDRMVVLAEQGKLDVVAVWKLDRLGRSLIHLVTLLDQLACCGVEFVSLRDSGIDTTTASGRLMFQMLGAFAEFERDLIRERTLAGVRKAQLDGTHCGRPRRELDLRAAQLLLGQGHGIRKVAAMLGLPRATLSRRLVEAGSYAAGAPMLGAGPEAPAAAPQ